MLARVALGHVIREKRTQQGLTLRDLCARSHVAVSYLSEVERGQKEASSEMLRNISDGLHITDADLLLEAGFIMQELHNLTQPVLTATL